MAALASALYLDSSAVLRPLLERGLSPDLEARLAGADVRLRVAAEGP